MPDWAFFVYSNNAILESMRHTTSHRTDYITLFRTLILCLVVLFAYSICTLHSEAYFTTNQEAVRLDQNSILFTIDYQFGHKKHTMTLPVLAEPHSITPPTAVSYQIVDENGDVAGGKSTGIVFSSARLNNSGLYEVTRGTLNDFSLNVIFTPAEYDMNKKYTLNVTHLPFMFDGVQQLQLNPSELKYYTATTQ